MEFNDELIQNFEFFFSTKEYRAGQVEGYEINLQGRVREKAYRAGQGNVTKNQQGRLQVAKIVCPAAL